MAEAVLDASAILALTRQEAGAEAVAEVIGGSLVSAVNHSEIVSKLTERGAAPDLIRKSLGQFPYRIVDFDAALAFHTGLLRSETRALGLSLGDRACLALARREKLPAFTADRRWADLDLDVDIRVVR